MSDEVSQKVKHIIGANLGLADEEVKENLYLRDDLNADQLTSSDIAVSLEEEFKIEIPQESLEHFQTVGDIITYIAEHLNEL